ncbi:hypothetical protein [Streptomyces sp. NPDC046909]|uniref:hypothetical protein n=1 Tax=Streptomyces sp. NPDC046909 TaxID=3155617 RepID=UPI0033D67975
MPTGFGWSATPPPRGKNYPCFKAPAYGFQTLLPGVNHVFDDGDIAIRTHDGAALVSHARRNGSSGVVVAYEADDVDFATRLGSNVAATGCCAAPRHRPCASSVGPGVRPRSVRRS